MCGNNQLKAIHVPNIHVYSVDNFTVYKVSFNKRLNHLPQSKGIRNSEISALSPMLSIRETNYQITKSREMLVWSQHDLQLS